MHKPEEYQPKQLTPSEFTNSLSRKELYSTVGPNNVILQVNYSCYLECVMCDRHLWSRDGAPVAETMTLNDLTVLFSQLADLKTNKITLVGTEPILRPDLPEILADIHDKGMKAELYTAGIVLSDTNIDAILQNSVDTAFSIDGFYSESHNNIRLPGKSFNAFSRTVSSIHRLVERRSQFEGGDKDSAIVANFTIQKANISDLLTAGPAEIDALGVDNLRLSIVHGTGPYTLDQKDIATIINFSRKIAREPGRTVVDFSSAIEFLLNNRIKPADFDKNILIPSAMLDGKNDAKCYIHQYSTMIDPQGNVRPCLYLYDDNGPLVDSDRDHFIVGNVKNNDFKEIWNGQAYQAFRKEYEYPNLNPGSRCLTCEYAGDFEKFKSVKADQAEMVNIGW